MNPFVVLVGFSTAGKSYYWNVLKNDFGNDVNCIDSDHNIAEGAGFHHIYDIFFNKGKKEGIAYIEEKENELLQKLEEPNAKPTLLAAGPFLVIRKSWKHFINKSHPFIIHFDKSAESIYVGLIGRKEKQKRELNIDDPLFGCWDEDVTTELKDGKYIDIPQERAIENIKRHLSGITSEYIKYRSHVVQSDELKNDPKSSEKLIDLIKSKLGLY